MVLKKTLLLASQSPRRRAILNFWGIPFRAVPPHQINEKAFPGESPRHLVSRLALQKASRISRRFSNYFVLGADTVVVSKGKILGKPLDLREAFGMIQGLSIRPHFVHTGVALLGPKGKKIGIHVETSRMVFHALTRKVIETYVRSSEPYDKAGAYDIRGSAGKWVSQMNGDCFNVMGLPSQWLMTHLKAMGIIPLRRS